MKKLQVDQKMEAMVRQAEQLVQRQDANNKSTESSKPEQLPQLSKSEDQAKEGMDSCNRTRRTSAIDEGCADGAGAGSTEVC